MPAPSSTDEFLTLVAKSDLLVPQRLEEYLARRRADNSLPQDNMKLALMLVNDGLLTRYQAEQLLAGRWRNFVIGGKYKLLERIGQGGMALVFLCEHKVMKRLVALKILPTAHGEDKELLGRFHREARALSQLRHPNIVGAYDIDHANKVHFLVMEYIDGGDLEQIVQKSGPLAWERAANYIRQAAHGLQHAHECGLVHRDIKPGNVLVDRVGVVKLLDLGLARIFHETTDDLTTGRDAKTLLGTVDYLAPEQALNSHDVDIRADIYGLGATFYYILTGKGLFEDGTVAQKLSWHLHRPPVPISDVRPDVPPELLLIIEKMLAKRPEDRYQTPEEVDEALEPFTLEPIAPPDPEELPQLSRAARGAGHTSSVRMKAPSIRTSTTTPIPSPGARVTPLPSKATATPRPMEAPIEAALDTKPIRQSRKPLVMVLATVVLLLVGAAGIWAYFGPAIPTEVVVTPPTKVLVKEPAPPAPPAVVAPVADSKPVAPTVPPSTDQSADAVVTVVSEKATSSPFANLRDAIHAAKPGDRIEIRGSLLVEAVELSDAAGAPKNLTIEGINTRTKGQPLRWRAPRDLSGGRALLEVSSLEGFRLKGFQLDGQSKVAELLRLSGRGAGAVLEDLDFRGATRASIVVKGWVGESENPATILRCSFTTDDEPEAAILIEADPDRPTVASEAIRVLSSRFVGSYQAAFLIGGAVGGLDIEQCRFLRTTDALRYRRSDARNPLRVKLANNTFVDLQKGLHFETTPPASASSLELDNNIFAGTPRIAVLDKVSVLPSKVAGSWIWTEEGKKNSTAQPGVRMFRKTFDVTGLPEKAMLDISCDETFTVWINDTEVGRNPSPHYTQRVFSYDVTTQLRKGHNVLAVQGTNRLDRLDARFGTTAGLLAQITTPQAKRENVLVKTDETWKWSAQGPEGWTKPEFDDKAWSTAKRWPDDGATWPWKFAVWDSVVLPQLKAPLEPITIKAAGNVRDYKTWEGYPTIDSERVVIADTLLSRNPKEEATFLRYPNAHPLATAGPNNSPVGVFEEK